jgi:hypothetical protein
MPTGRYRAEELTYDRMVGPWSARVARFAYHEAGHAIVAHALGLGVVWVCVDVSNGPLPNGCLYGPDGFVATVVRGRGALTEADRLTMVDFACTIVGAWEAEILETGWPWEEGWRHDRVVLRKIARRLRVPVARLIDEQRKRARDILAGRQPALRRVATAALTAETATGHRRCLSAAAFLEVIAEPR